MTTQELAAWMGIGISLVTLLGILPSVLAMKSILKDYQKKPLKTDGEISGGFIRTALDSNQLTQEVQKQLKEYIAENIEYKHKVKMLEEDNLKKDIEIAELKSRVQELENIIHMRKNRR